MAAAVQQSLADGGYHRRTVGVGVDGAAVAGVCEHQRRSCTVRTLCCGHRLVGVSVVYDLTACHYGTQFYHCGSDGGCGGPGDHDRLSPSGPVSCSITIVAGLLYIVLAIFKMGWISNFLSESVLTGFIFGIGIDVVVGQLGKITGTTESGANTWQKFASWIQSLPQTNPPTLILGVGLIALLVLLRFRAPKVPGRTGGRGHRHRGRAHLSAGSDGGQAHRTGSERVAQNSSANLYLLRRKYRRGAAGRHRCAAGWLFGIAGCRQAV